MNFFDAYCICLLGLYVHDREHAYVHAHDYGIYISHSSTILCVWCNIMKPPSSLVPLAPKYNELQNITYMPQSISYMYGYMYIAALCVYVFGMYMCIVYGIEHIYTYTLSLRS